MEEINLPVRVAEQPVYSRPAFPRRVVTAALVIGALLFAVAALRHRADTPAAAAPAPGLPSFDPAKLEMPPLLQAALKNESQIRSYRTTGTRTLNARQQIVTTRLVYNFPDGRQVKRIMRALVSTDVSGRQKSRPGEVYIYTGIDEWHILENASIRVPSKLGVIARAEEEVARLDAAGYAAMPASFETLDLGPVNGRHLVRITRIEPPATIEVRSRIFAGLSAATPAAAPPGRTALAGRGAAIAVTEYYIDPDILLCVRKREVAANGAVVLDTGFDAVETGVDVSEDDFRIPSNLPMYFPETDAQYRSMLFDLYYKSDRDVTVTNNNKKD